MYCGLNIGPTPDIDQIVEEFNDIQFIYLVY